MSTLLDTSGLVLHTDRPQKVLGDAYLKVQLEPQTTAVLLMKQVQEVLSLPVNRLTAMPNMPPAVMGLMSRRSRVLWTVDLAQMLGLSSLNQHGNHYHTIILQPGAVPLGAIVRRIDGMAWLQAEQLQPPPGQIPSSLVPYLHGCVLQGREVLLVLDVEAIVRSPQMH